MQVPGAKDVGVEFFTLSKSYNMPGWRVGFAVGNREMIAALARLKSYFDYGMFAPVQVAAIAALNGPQECVARDRRDLSSSGATCWSRDSIAPDGRSRSRKATMFVWAPIPEPFRAMGSLEFAKFLLAEAKVAVSPGRRLRRRRRRLRALRADRERASHAPGDPRNPSRARAAGHAGMVRRVAAARLLSAPRMAIASVHS